MNTKRDETIKKINDMISDIKVAMLTTVDADGDFHSSPMFTQEREFDGDVWFFAERSSNKVREIQEHPSVNVAYVNDGNFVSIAGEAHIVTDLAKKEALWHSGLEKWFEDGPASADVVLIKIHAHTAQYWDSPSNLFSKAMARVKVMLTDEKHATGDNAKVQF